jgi:hypothetical protein
MFTAMTNYHLKSLIPSSLLAQQKKAERRKVLEAVRARRKIIYQRFRENMQQQADRDML